MSPYIIGQPTHIIFSETHIATPPTTVLDLYHKQSFIQLQYFLC
jgi:hypothetical protein